MDILVKSSSGISQVSADSKLLSQRKIFLEGEINDNTASDFVKKIMLLNCEAPNKHIDILFFTPGGEINAGLFMLDVIQSSQAPIRMYCAKAYSMGAVLFSSGTHGRFMLPHGEVMLHEPLLGSKIGGNSTSLKSISDSLLETKQRLNQILAQNTGRSVREIEKACSYDHYFDPKESVDFGLADAITDFSKFWRYN